MEGHVLFLPGGWYPGTYIFMGSIWYLEGIHQGLCSLNFVGNGTVFYRYISVSPAIKETLYLWLYFWHLPIKHTELLSQLANVHVYHLLNNVLCHPASNSHFGSSIPWPCLLLQYPYLYLTHLLS